MNVKNIAKSCLAALMSMLCVATFAQNTLTGTVVDGDGLPVIGASVVVNGTTNGISTDVNGKFALNNVPGDAVLHVSFIGYQAVDVAVNNRTSIDITLKEDSEAIDEVVVVGFGVQKKVNLTGSVSTVSAKDIASRPVNSVVDALQGMVPGMNVYAGATGGALNSTKGFNIRGGGTIGSNSTVSPLVLIDGMEGDLSTLNPQDIETLSVLKDASTASIYGSRAAGGVVLVTTKKGKSGKAQVNYNNRFSFESPLNMPEMADSYTWALTMNTAAINGGSGQWFSQAQLDRLKQVVNGEADPMMYANGNNQWEIWDTNELLPSGNTDWLKEHFKSTFTHEHNVSVSGGSDAMQYYFSANYLNQGGKLRHGDDNAQRYTVNGKINAKVAKWLDMGYNIRFSRRDLRSPQVATSGGDQWDGGNLFFYNVCRYWPIIPAYDPNGNPVTESYIDELENGGIYKTQSDETAQQLSLRITPVKGWIINAELNYRVTNENVHQDWLTTYGYDVDGAPFVFHNATTSVYEYALKDNYFAPSVFTEYSHDWNGHNFKVMAGFQAEQLKRRTLSGQKDGILAGLPTLNTTSTNPRTGGAYNHWTTAGFFGRVNYDYKGRYLFEFNIRYDGTSRFIGDARWGTFPSVSAGWNIAEESFMENVRDKVNTLKLRASWGELGNCNTNAWYPFYQTMGYGSNGANWLTNDKATPAWASMPDLVSSSLTWEKSRTWEIGLDWGLFNNRLTGTFGYYQRNQYDMVGPGATLPDVLGASVPPINNLETTTRGWDLQISWRDRTESGFSYGATLSMSDYQTTVDSYPNETKAMDKPYYNGMKLGEIWGYTTIGIAKSQEEMDAHLAKVDQSALGSGWTAGDIMFADLDNTGAIDFGKETADDYGDITVIGNRTPRYNFGLNLEAAWKGFDLKVFFQGTLKRDYMPNGTMFWGASGIGKWWAGVFKDQMDYFRPDANDPLGQNLDSYYPAPSWSSGRNNKTQTRYLQNAAYARLKNVTIGYTLPKKISQKFAVENLRVFLSLENMWTITNFTKMGDPELIDATTREFGTVYPLSKTVSFGINVTF